MYDWEIENYIAERDLKLDQNEFLHIISTSPQINHQKYEPFEDKFHLWTEDGGHYEFQVKYKGEK
mgnify:CR=1 FL=1